MEYHIQVVPGRTLAGFHLVGPWERTVKQGFEQLSLWVNSQKYPAQEWIAVYFDNPETTPPEKLRCDTMVTVPVDFTVPPGSEGVIRTRLEGGLFAVARARVVNQDFSTPWLDFFALLEADKHYQLRESPCFEIYLSDGSDGVWDIDMYIGVQEVHVSAA
ncbi:DNA gyrase inhibitor SbmC [Enterobacteriaceae bacterium 4M9]|nr:DNA gyrase inhibitor SbmC [Enterobacteriaceae bacterium 4M9]